MKGSSRDPGRRGVRMGITSVKQPNITGAPSSADLLNDEQIQSAVKDALSSTQFIDVHTHLFSPAFGNLGLWGIDELLTYHYLEAEFFRSSDTTPERFWNLRAASSRFSMRLTCPRALPPWKRREPFSERNRSRSTFETCCELRA